MFYVKKGNELNNIFNSFDSLFNMGSMATDIEDDEKQYNLYIDLPGVNKKDISIKYEDDLLTVSVKYDNDNSKKNFIKKERVSRAIERSYSLENGNPEAISAKLNDGVLSIIVEKMPKIDNKKIITIE